MLEEAPRVVVSSSAEIYGPVPADRQPILEDFPLQPISPYAVSKASLDLIAAQYHRGFGLPTIRLRLFPHTGPRRSAQFVASSFARQIARVERGLNPPRLAAGNLDAIRDFCDVRDVVHAYWLAATDGRAGQAYNVCSGRGVGIREMLDLLLSQSEAEIEVEVDPDRLRPADIPMLVGDGSLFAATTGWRPEIPLERTLEDLLECRRRIETDQTKGVRQVQRTDCERRQQAGPRSASERRDDDREVVEAAVDPVGLMNMHGGVVVQQRDEHHHGDDQAVAIDQASDLAAHSARILVY